jgi:hypothetical protein
MALTVDTTLVTNVCTWVGRAHNAYIRVVGNEGNQNGPFYWLEAVKSYARGGNDLTTGITSGSLVAVAQVGPGVTVNVTGGAVTILGAAVTCATNATYGSSTIWGQTCTDGSALIAGQFYDAALCCDHLGVLTVFRGPREDRLDTEQRPDIPQGYCLIAMIRILYNGSGTSIATANITLGQTLTAYAAQTNDPAARIFGDFDAGQAALISRKAVKNELGFALTSLDKYIQSITASQGLGTNGAGLTLLAWAKATHQTATPFDFPAGFAEFIRVLRNGKDHSMRLATVAFTGSGTATVVDKKQILGLQDAFEVVVTNVGSTGAAASTIAVTVQSTGGTTATTYTANVPPSQPNGTVIAMASTGTAAIQNPIPGTAANAVLTGSNVLAAQPAGVVTTRVYTSLVASSPIAVTGGTSGDAFAVRNTGVL